MELQQVNLVTKVSIILFKAVPTKPEHLIIRNMVLVERCAAWLNLE
jgi:hypothetical protein